MLAIHYCQCCREEILEYAYLAFEVLEVVCEFYYFHECCIEFCTTPGEDSSEMMPIIKWLEEKQLVVTTECSENWISVKPLGAARYNDDGDTLDHFCPCCKIERK